MNWPLSITDSASYHAMQIHIETEQEAMRKESMKRERNKKKMKEDGGDKSEGSKKSNRKREEKEEEVAEIQWISQNTAVFMVEQTMSKSTEADRDKVILRILQKSMPARGRIRGMDDYDSEDEDEDTDGKKAVDCGVALSLLMQE